jgi:hypothetical protein
MDVDVSCCETCADTHRIVKELHEAFQKIGSVLGEAMQNPMVRMMARQSGIPLEQLENAGIGRQDS